MTMTLEILDTMNSIIREEKGTRVTIDDSLRDADLDSFGITMLFFELDEKYEYFKDIPDDVDVFTTIPYDTITIKAMVAKCI